jgi:hypothetical protein
MTADVLYRDGRGVLLMRSAVIFADDANFRHPLALRCLRGFFLR